MKTDAQLKHEVEQELEWDPAVNASHVGVAVDKGVVTLSGHLETYGEKYLVERAVQRVQGVKALAVELDVKLAPGHKRNDSELAQAAEAALTWHTLVPDERLTVKVEGGWVTLRGDVDWEYQRNAAAQAIRSLTGVLGFTNEIVIKPRVMSSNVTTRIREALARHAEREADRIEVQVSGATATLKGTVHSWAERAAAQGAAWSAPGVTSVINELKVGA
ncbi:BON domain-containing protein [Variovorax sp. JS1663]|uniref:BON domain-containing protein n=1 Tax=Variovorax sp. JS1663 TaxID=1851577 RepID=UPI000B342983|nr:BON domain-containing protein [Variovorax sp. JS1663]OUM00915.1 OsmY domain-containing protein [Variovorax sp. JS1663]